MQAHLHWPGLPAWPHGGYMDHINGEEAIGIPWASVGIAWASAGIACVVIAWASIRGRRQRDQVGGRDVWTEGEQVGGRDVWTEGEQVGGREAWREAAPRDEEAV